MTRHMFPGGNTPSGFFSYFSQILPLEEAERTIYLKGASGSGKSTFMKKIGEAFEKQGNSVDYLHCSNDAASLDGICIRDIKVSIVDGTAPHVGDPVIPMGIDKIFNVADFIDEDVVRAHKEELRSLVTAKKQYFDKAYRYFSAAYQVYLNNSYIFKEALEKGKLNKAIADELLLFSGLPVAECPGKNRRLFASAITPFGMKSFVDMIVNNKTIVLVCGEDGMGTDLFLEEVQKAANCRGLNTESYYCPLNPSKLEHLVIPEMELSYTTANRYHKTNLISEREISFDHYLKNNTLSEHQDEISYNYDMFDELLNRAMKTMAEQKVLHDRIEEIYVSSMDFKGLESAGRSLISELINQGGNKN